MMKQKEEENRKDRREALHGWRNVRLGEVISEAQGGFASGERDTNGVIQLRMNNVTTRGQFEWSSFLRVPADSDTIAEYRLQSGDILFNNTNSAELVGKTALFEDYEEPIVFSNHFTRLRTDPDCLLPSFLAFWLQAQWQNGLFANICNRWIGQSAVQRDKLLSLEIPLPPLPEQKRIAAILNEQLTTVERARAAAEAQLKAAKALPSAYFRQAFCNITPLAAGIGRDTAPRGWKWQQLTSLARLESGHTPSRYHPEWWGGNVPWISLADIRDLDGKVTFETKEYTNEAGIENSSARILPAGTVVLSRTASVGFVSILGKEMATSQDFVNWVCGPELDPYFLMFLLLASRDYIRSLSSGAIHQTVYVPTVKAFETCIPSLSEQRRIATFLKEHLAEADRLRQGLEERLAVIDKLPSSLLRQAFNGEL